MNNIRVAEDPNCFFVNRLHRDDFVTNETKDGKPKTRALVTVELQHVEGMAAPIDLLFEADDKRLEEFELGKKFQLVALAE